VFTIKIKANVDTGVLEKKIKEIKADTKRKDQLGRLQAENVKLLKELEAVSAQLRSGKTGEYKKLREQREKLFEQLDKNQNSISITFEKGTLLNLALKSNSEIEELKSNIDEFIKYYADNVKYKLGEPQVRNNGEFSDLLIPVEVWFENIPRLLELAKTFDTWPTVKYDQYISIGYYYKGLKPGELGRHFTNYYAKIHIKAGKYSTSIDLIKYSSSVYIKDRQTLAITKIPTAELSNIGSIDAEVVYGNIRSPSNSTAAESAAPPKRKPTGKKQKAQN
jgi:hypothetical protein